MWAIRAISRTRRPQGHSPAEPPRAPDASTSARPRPPGGSPPLHSTRARLAHNGEMRYRHREPISPSRSQRRRPRTGSNHPGHPIGPGVSPPRTNRVPRRHAASAHAAAGHALPPPPRRAARSRQRQGRSAARSDQRQSETGSRRATAALHQGNYATSSPQPLSPFGPAPPDGEADCTTLGGMVHNMKCSRHFRRF